MHKGSNGYRKYKKVLDIGAYEYYTMSREKEGTYPFNRFLFPTKLIRFGEQIGRRITAREMRFLVSLDVTCNDRFSLMSERCTVHSKHFTPVRWVDVKNPRFIELVRGGLEIDMALVKLGSEVKEFGCFYPRYQGRCDAYSGPLLSKNGSPLAMIHTAEGNLGVPRAQAKQESWQIPTPSSNESSKKKEKPLLTTSSRK